MHLWGRRREWEDNLQGDRGGTSLAPVPSCLAPQGHNVSTTSNIKLLCGIFCTLNGLELKESNKWIVYVFPNNNDLYLSHPVTWQLVNFPFSGWLMLSLSACNTYKSVLLSQALTLFVVPGLAPWGRIGM